MMGPIREAVRPMRETAGPLRAAHLGQRLPWVVTYDGQFAGELGVWAIAWGSSRSAQVYYWIDESFAGRGIIPTALAMAVDHCFRVVGLHRLEASIRPENTASRRVVEKLGFREEALHVRQVHINGAWRDHICYAITAEEVPTGMLSRWRSLLSTSRSGASEPALAPHQPRSGGA